jgi:hypothetical protein
MDEVDQLKGGRSSPLDPTRKLYRSRNSLEALLVYLKKEEEGFAATATAYKNSPQQPHHGVIEKATGNVASKLSDAIVCAEKALRDTKGLGWVEP